MDGTQFLLGLILCVHTCQCIISHTHFDFFSTLFIRFFCHTSDKRQCIHAGSYKNPSVLLYIQTGLHKQAGIFFEFFLKLFHCCTPSYEFLSLESSSMMADCSIAEIDVLPVTMVRISSTSPRLSSLESCVFNMPLFTTSSLSSISFSIVLLSICKPSVSILRHIHINKVLMIIKFKITLLDEYSLNLF